jgi:hypothetical protein
MGYSKLMFFKNSKCSVRFIVFQTLSHSFYKMRIVTPKEGII